MQRAEQVICISENTKSDLLKFFNVPEDKVSVVHHGYNYFPNKKVVIKKMIKYPFLLYVGSRNSYKNFKNFIKAFSRSNSLSKDFKIIAFGGGKFKNSERNFINECNIENNIKHIEGDDEVLSNLYAKAEALIYPSLYEGFGMPILEAMAHGCPVITSNKSSIPEVAGEAAKLFDPTNLDSIRESIENVLYSDGQKKELIDKGYKQLENFSWEKCAKKTLSAYKKSDR